jgi:hypothetical protein
VGRQVSVTKVGGVCDPLLTSFGGVWGMDVWNFAKVHLQRGARNDRRPPEGRHTVSKIFKIPTFSFFHIALLASSSLPCFKACVVGIERVRVDVRCSGMRLITSVESLLCCNGAVQGCSFTPFFWDKNR